jgi:hypothetical protein
MNWVIKVFSYIELKTFLEIMTQDNMFFKKIIKKILCHFYDIKNKKINKNNCITNFFNIYPKINSFLIDGINYDNEIIYQKNNDCTKRYLLAGKPSNQFVFSNNVLPNSNNSNIPFTFSYTNDLDIVEFVSSNIYYFEFTIDKIKFREEFLNEQLLIGFVSGMFNSNDFNFGDHFSFGIDCFNGIFKHDDQLFELPKKIIPGDTVGLGIEYLEKFKYRIIITINGERIFFEKNHDYIYNNNILKVALNLKLSKAVTFNFGDERFKFNIKELINCSKVINICNNNFINLRYSYSLIKSDKIYDNNIFLKKSIVNDNIQIGSIYNLSKKLLKVNTYFNEPSIDL